MKAIFSYGHRHQFRYAGNTTLEARADLASGLRTALEHRASP